MQVRGNDLQSMHAPSAMLHTHNLECTEPILSVLADDRYSHSAVGNDHFPAPD
jgi:hypothetical protein